MENIINQFKQVCGKVKNKNEAVAEELNKFFIL